MLITTLIATQISTIYGNNLESNYVDRTRVAINNACINVITLASKYIFTLIHACWTFAHYPTGLVLTPQRLTTSHPSATIHNRPTTTTRPSGKLTQRPTAAPSGRFQK